MHVSWIQDGSARNIDDPNYREENIVINMESLGVPGIACIVKADFI